MSRIPPQRILAMREICNESIRERCTYIKAGSILDVLDALDKAYERIDQLEVQQNVDRATWLTMDEMADVLSGFGMPGPSARGFARAIALASMKKGEKARTQISNKSTV